MLYICVYRYIHIYIYMIQHISYIYLITNILESSPPLYIIYIYDIYTCMYIHMYLHKYTYVYIHIYTYTYIYIYINTHTYIY